MSTTLTNGLKLPDKGSVDWYADMQSNYAILDGAVGTVAEHTTQIAGKAPAVHTHTKADITDFPAYGTTAGTICEGNDSRLSDARTPVAHTHTKSDVTDLFNSANTWNESQTYSKTAISNAGEILHCKNATVVLGETPASEYQKSFLFKDKNNDNFGYFRHWYQTTGTSQFDILIRNKFTNGAPDTSGSIDFASFSLKLNADKSKEGVLMGSFKPSNTNTYDLGSSAYQWNNLYAKNYYYNGTAWGLDKANVWSGSNSFKNITLSANAESVEILHNTWHGYEQYYTRGTSNYPNYDTFLKWNSNRYDNTIGLYRSVGVLTATTEGATVNDIDESFAYYIYHINAKYVDFMGNIRIINDSTYNFLAPLSNGDTDLGTSTNKWKTLNGINPGALSLPNIDTTYRQSVDTTDWILDGSSANSFTPSISGWLNIRITDAVGNYIFMQSRAVSVSNQSTGSLPSSVSKPLSALIPVIAGEPVSVLVQTTSIVGFIYPCLGNV